MSGTPNPLKPNARPNGKGMLESLSDEILLMILKSVFTPLESPCHCYSSDSPSNGQTILNIALCSRRLFEVAEPFLFHEITDKYYRIDKKVLQLLLCRVLANPDMQRNVYKIQTGAVKSCMEATANMDLSMIRPDDWQRIRDAVRTCSRSEEESARWIGVMEKGHWDGFIALLLSITPNLQELHISGWDQYDAKFPFLTTVLERAAELQKRSVISAGSLSNLRDIALSYWDTEGGMGTDTFDLFLGIQSVTSFIACMIEVYQWDGFNPANWDVGSYDCSKNYNLRNLDVHDSSMGPDSLIETLRWFPYLERLSYSHSGHQSLVPPAIRAGLKHLEPCLQDLILSNDGYSDFGGDFDKFTIGSLVAFQRLRYLDLSQSMLIGSEDVGSKDHGSQTFEPTQDLVTSLPPKLEHLCIREYDRGIVEPVFELIAKKCRHTPALKFLDLSWTKTVYPDKDPELILEQPVFTNEEVLKLLAECKAAGVEMVLTGVPPEDKTIKLIIEGKKLMIDFEYPYSRYKVWCEHYGCDLETGEPASFDSEFWLNAEEWDGDFSKVKPPQVC